MSMDIAVGTKVVPFDLWRPGDTLQGTLIAMDTETAKIVPGEIPPLVITVATDGQSGFFIANPHVVQFVNTHANATWLMHNAAFDIHVLEQAGCDLHSLVDTGRIFDTGLLYRLLKLADTGSCHGQWSLDHVCHELLKVMLPKDVRAHDGQDVRVTFGRFLDPDGRPDYHEMLKPENRSYLTYTAGDAVATWLAANELNSWAKRLLDAPDLDICRAETYGTAGVIDGVDMGNAWRVHGFLSHNIQLKGSLALATTERNAMYLDMERVDDALTTLDAALKKQKDALKEQFNWQSGAGSRRRIEEILKQAEKDTGEHLPRLESGAYSLAADDLEEYADKIPFVRIYLDYQGLTKIRNTFMSPLEKGRAVVRGHFNVLVNTGRTSCSGGKGEDGEREGLNLQNLPREGDVRRCFTPSPGHLLFACDYSTIELVTLAQHSLKKYGHSKMAEAIRKGADLHCVLAARLKGIDICHLERWDKKSILPLLGFDGDSLRNKAKPVNFGFPGGLGAQTFVQFARASYDIEVTEEQAKAQKKAWLDAWPEMRQHLSSDDLRLLASRFPHLWVTHPTVRGSFRPGKLPWPVHILRGVLCGRTATHTTNRSYTKEEIDWAWQCAAEILLNSSHIPESRRAVLDVHVRERIAGHDLQCALSPRQRFVATLTGRLRGHPAYCAARNTVFQGLAADGAKLALYRLYREGFRIVNFIHDEVLIELPENADHTVLAGRVESIMVAEMREVVPDLPVLCEYALMRRWYKGAKPKFVNGHLVPVKPVVLPDGRTEWVHDEGR